MSKDPTDIGMNRTGIATSPLQSQEAVQAPELFPPTSTGGARRFHEAQAAFARESTGTVQGTVPPPAGVKGVLKTAVGMLKGHKESVFLDKLGERAGYERAGTRLYEAVLVKFDTYGTWPGGPTRARLEEIRREEAAHFDLVAECIRELGGDPTSTTPSANVHAVASLGLFQVVGDPRTDLRQALEMLLVAELTDNAAWELLAGLAREMGHARMAERFEEAHRREAYHLADVRGWLEQGVGRDAGVEMRE